MTSPSLLRGRGCGPCPAALGAKRHCPTADPKIRSPKPTFSPRGDEGLVLTSRTGCRDKPSGGCRAPRRRRHPPALRGKAAVGHWCPVGCAQVTLGGVSPCRSASSSAQPQASPGNAGSQDPRENIFNGEKPQCSQAPAPRSTGWRRGVAPPPAGKSLLGQARAAGVPAGDELQCPVEVKMRRTGM